MGELIVIEFPSEAKAEEVRQRFLNNMLKEYHIQPYDAVIATKQADGNVKLNELLRPTGTGAASRLSDLIDVPAGSFGLSDPLPGADRCRHQSPLHKRCLGMSGWG
jgi:uncharacterized membrane protein